MEYRIRLPGGIAAVGDELDLDELDQVAGGLDRAWTPAQPGPATLPLATASAVDRGS